VFAKLGQAIFTKAVTLGFQAASQGFSVLSVVYPDRLIWHL